MSKDRIKSIYSNYALVGSEIGNILFKKKITLFILETLKKVFLIIQKEDLIIY